MSFPPAQTRYTHLMREYWPALDDLRLYDRKYLAADIDPTLRALVSLEVTLPFAVTSAYTASVLAYFRAALHRELDADDLVAFEGIAGIDISAKALREATEGGSRAPSDALFGILEERKMIERQLIADTNSHAAISELADNGPTLSKVLDAREKFFDKLSTDPNLSHNDTMAILWALQYTDSTIVRELAQRIISELREGATQQGVADFWHLPMTFPAISLIVGGDSVLSLNFMLELVQSTSYLNMTYSEEVTLASPSSSNSNTTTTQRAVPLMNAFWAAVPSPLVGAMGMQLDILEHLFFFHARNVYRLTASETAVDAAQSVFVEGLARMMPSEIYAVESINLDNTGLTHRSVDEWASVFFKWEQQTMALGAAAQEGLLSFGRLSNRLTMSPPGDLLREFLYTGLHSIGVRGTNASSTVIKTAIQPAWQAVNAFRQDALSDMLFECTMKNHLDPFRVSSTGTAENVAMVDALVVESFFEMYAFAFGLSQIQSYTYLATHAPMARGVTKDGIRAPSNYINVRANGLLRGQMASSATYGEFVENLMQAQKEQYYAALQSTFTFATLKTEFRNFLRRMIPRDYIFGTSVLEAAFFGRAPIYEMGTALGVQETVLSDYMQDVIKTTVGALQKKRKIVHVDERRDVTFWEYLQQNGIDPLAVKTKTSGEPVNNMLVYFLRQSLARTGQRLAEAFGYKQTDATADLAYQVFFRHIYLRIGILANVVGTIDPTNDHMWINYEYAQPELALFALLALRSDKDTLKYFQTQYTTKNVDSPWAHMNMSHTKRDRMDPKTGKLDRFVFEALFWEEMGDYSMVNIQGINEILSLDTGSFSAAKPSAPHKKALERDEDSFWAQEEDEAPASSRRTNCASSMLEPEDDDSSSFDVSLSDLDADDVAYVPATARNYYSSGNDDFSSESETDYVDRKRPVTTPPTITKQQKLLSRGTELDWDEW